MDIGILGSGMIGSAVGRLLVDAGHKVAIANSRGPESLEQLVSELGPLATAASIPQAIAFGDPVVVLAIPFGRYQDLPAAELAGRIAVDTTNYTPARDGRIGELASGSVTSSELIAGHLPGTRLVKSLNTLYYRTMLERARPGAPRAERTAFFVAGDDAEANALVARLVEEIGFAAVATGSLREGDARQGTGSAVFNVPLLVDQVRREGW
ncbi:NAD(P)-binding domain-containing protein [Kitasatospora sp. NBC_01250]|uniref:NADPH-dependent F420 reductase n=1 Tax=unclassified Kitasatospora TaxID=2633591 RepID=UPI002E129962|nr:MULTISPECIES: NAD(P)-binding domain-containing protein [unclassified Kitasatospora]WSJ70911.1 NAD(P)-binding domain-containing protein [Kitasatospora sp. NBC_01302]